MPAIPNRNMLIGDSQKILNAIRNGATENYRNYVPIATSDPQSIRDIGAVIMQMPMLQNEFLSALVNRIGRVVLTSKQYQNPWSFFKKGLLEFGETVEEIFTNLCKVQSYDPVDAETTLFTQEIPDVRAAFHVMNYQKVYPATIRNDQLRQAFLSWEGITDLIASIVNAMYTAANYDEFLTMKYLLARQIIVGRLPVISVPEANAENAKEIVSTVKQTSNQMEFMSTNYNMAGVYTFSDKNDQFVLVNANFDAIMDVEVLASAFNMDKAEFMGHRVLVDGFGNLDTARLAELFANDSNYVEIDSGDITLLNSIPAVIVDREFFQIYDNFQNFTENYNGKGLYWQYFFHAWKTFSVSPFSNAAVFMPGAQTVTAVAITPDTVTVAKGQNVSFAAIVTATNFANQAVNWSITTDVVDGTYIDNSGNLHVGANETASSITVQATSVFNSSAKDTATVTVSGN